MHKISLLSLLAALSMLALVACGGDMEHNMEGMNMDMIDGENTAVTVEMNGSLSIEDAWGRNSPMAAQNGAFYMRVLNGTDSDDTLVAASADVCGVAELHEMYMKEDDVMGMRPVEGGIRVPSGGMAELKVGGLHVMCLDKTQEFNVGDAFPVTLTFESGTTLETTVEIRDSAPDMGGMDMDNDG